MHLDLDARCLPGIAQHPAKVEAEAPNVSEREVLEALHAFWDLWGQLIPAEQARIVRLTVERVVVTAARCRSACVLPASAR